MFCSESITNLLGPKIVSIVCMINENAFTPIFTPPTHGEHNELMGGTKVHLTGTRVSP